MICHIYFKSSFCAPSYQTGLLWVKKTGYYQLNTPKEKAEDWIIIADESIGIGQEKVLVILGIRKKDIPLNRPLKLRDMEALLVKSKEKWTGEDIAEQLKIVKQQIGGILYAVTDSCSTLKKGLRKTKIKHLYDITHAIAIGLERLYKDDPEFKEYTHQMGQMRLKYCCSKFAHLIPPNQRSKARFQNIDIISMWGQKAINALDKDYLSSEERQVLMWLKDKKLLIAEMNSIMNIIKEISTILKNNGLSCKTKNKCILVLKKCKNGRMKKFCQYMTTYLNENIALLQNKKDKLLCSSDIIESTFGKYKNEISKNPMHGITDLSLIIAAFTSDLSADSVCKAIDYSTVKDLKNWNTKNLCESLSKKRIAKLKNIERN